MTESYVRRRIEIPSTSAAYIEAGVGDRIAAAIWIADIAENSTACFTVATPEKIRRGERRNRPQI